MINYKEAQRLIINEARSFGVEEIGLGEAYGRVIGETVYADRDYPPFDRATMDGYALRHGELSGGRTEWRVAGTLFAGNEPKGELAAGACYKIMTGAAVPAGFDLVVRREDTVEREGMMTLLVKGVLRPYLNIARRGEDLHMGDPVIKPGSICDASLVGLLATLGKARLLVSKMPRVKILTTGNEIVAADTLHPGAVQIRNSNRWVLQALLTKWGIHSVEFLHVADDPVVLRAAIASALANDILICTGGVSAGDADYVPGVMQELKVRRLFHKMAIKPGKPAWCGVMPGGGMAFALPGNPFSCLVGFVLLIEPYLRRCWGLPDPEVTSAPIETARIKRTPLDEFFPVRLSGDPVRLRPLSLNGSGDIRLGMQADGLGIQPAGDGELAAGTLVGYITIRSPW